MNNAYGTDCDSFNITRNFYDRFPMRTHAGRDEPIDSTPKALRSFRRNLADLHHIVTSTALFSITHTHTHLHTLWLKVKKETLFIITFTKLIQNLPHYTKKLNDLTYQLKNAIRSSEMPRSAYDKTR